MLILTLLPFFEINAQQKHDYNWAFGYGTGIPNDTIFFGGFIMSFENNQIHFKPQARDFEFNWQTNNYSNNFGALQYMSNGCSIVDHEAIPLFNGDSINYGRARGSCPKYNIDSESAFFFNYKKDSSYVYFIHAVYDTIGLRQHREALLLSKIEKISNRVIILNKFIYKDTLLSSGLNGLLSKDENSWWIINPILFRNEYIVIQLEGDSIKKLIRTKIGLPFDSIVDATPQGTFSPNGKKYAIYTPLRGLQVFDFDRDSGVLSNFNYYNLKYSRNIFGGCCFSPDSRFIYICNPTEVLQIDLYDPNPSTAVDTVGVYDNFFDPYPTTFLQMVLGPDCRIYISTYGGNRYLHVILHPNQKGKACQLVNRGLKLPARNSFATPNNPHYRTNDPYPCDSTIRIPLNVNVNDFNGGIIRNGDLLVYPIPANDYITIQLIRQISKGGVISIYNLQGSLKMEWHYNNLQDELRIDLPELQDGLYFIRVVDKSNMSWVEKLLIHH